MKVILQFRNNIHTPVQPDASDEMWGLAGNGSRAAPVLIPDGLFGNASGETPTFEELCTVKDETTLNAVTPTATPPAANTRGNGGGNGGGGQPIFKGKRGIVMPHFVARAIMDADTEDPIVMLQVVCKALNDFDEGTAGGYRDAREETTTYLVHGTRQSSIVNTRWKEKTLGPR